MKALYLGEMAIKPIITIPDSVLKQVSKPVESVNDEIRALIKDMLDSMYEAKGIGLAAIQIGVPLRVLVMDLAWGKNAEGEPDVRVPRVFINPEILEKTEETAPYEEGCLSVPEFYEEIHRPAKVTLKYLDESGEEKTEIAEGMFATCIQHEMDHLNGVLFIDYLSRLKRERALAKVKKAKKLAA